MDERLGGAVADALLRELQRDQSWVEQLWAVLQPSAQAVVYRAIARLAALQPPPIDAAQLSGPLMHPRQPLCEDGKGRDEFGWD